MKDPLERLLLNCGHTTYLSSVEWVMPRITHHRVPPLLLINQLFFLGYICHNMGVNMFLCLTRVILSRFYVDFILL